MKVNGLRSPHDSVGGIVYFGRMLDKIRLNAAGALPADYLPNLGRGFDRRCAGFLDVPYEKIADFVLSGATDEECLDWCFHCGRKPSTEEIAVWNAFMRKFGWNDEASASLKSQLEASGYGTDHQIETVFDFIDLDEGRHNPQA